MLHYDITSAYFAAAYSDSELIKYGYSRDQQPDTKQLNIGLTILQDGLPLAFRVLVGNTADKRPCAPPWRKQAIRVVRAIVALFERAWRELRHRPALADAAAASSPPDAADPPPNARLVPTRMRPSPADRQAQGRAQV